MEWNRTFVVILLVLSISGCASMHKSTLSEADRSNINNVLVLVSDNYPEMKFIITPEEMDKAGKPKGMPIGPHTLINRIIAEIEYQKPGAITDDKRDNLEKVKSYIRKSTNDYNFSSKESVEKIFSKNNWDDNIVIKIVNGDKFRNTKSPDEFDQVLLDEYKSIKHKNIDTVISIVPINIGIRKLNYKNDKNRYLIFAMFHYSVFKINNNGEEKILSKTVWHYGEENSIEYFVENNLINLKRNMANLAESVITEAMDDVLLTYKLGEKTKYVDGIEVKVPSYVNKKRPVLSTKNPILVWDKFPSNDYLKHDVSEQNLISKISNVTYELKLYELYPDRTEKYAYNNAKITHINNITKTSLNLKGIVSPCNKYLWIIRAHFKLNNENRASEWSMYGQRWPYSILQSSKLYGKSRNFYRRLMFHSFTTECTKTE